MSSNPFRPGAGHPPPHLAGRVAEKADFDKLLDQDVILKNAVLTGLRGVGKTVLLGEFKPMATAKDWGWVGSDLSETVSVSEENLAVRILTDLAILTSAVVVKKSDRQLPGFNAGIENNDVTLNYNTLNAVYQNTPGLVLDKLKTVLRFVAQNIPSDMRLIFAYDESQNLSDNAAKEEYPLSVLLDVFQAIQRENIPFMLVLAGLPTLFPKLVEARTYAERMFTILFLDSLNEPESREAIEIPLNNSPNPIKPTEESISSVCRISGGYPYFIQFICREAYDIWEVDPARSIPMQELIQKLDTDFFAGRWSRASDRQRELMFVISELSNSHSEFSVQEIVDQSCMWIKPFSNSHVNQMLSTLGEKGLIYKNRYGKYSFAVPMLGDFISRQPKPEELRKPVITS